MRPPAREAFRAPGRLVGLAREQRRELQLLGADRVHLLADDLLNLAANTQTQRQPREDSRCLATDVSGAKQQAVAGYLSIAGVFTERTQKELRKSCWHGFNVRRSGRLECAT